MTPYRPRVKYIETDRAIKVGTIVKDEGQRWEVMENTELVKVKLKLLKHET